MTNDNAGKIDVLTGRMTPDYRKRRGINDEIYTDPMFAKKIVDYFSPQFKSDDTFFEPCAGDNAFYNHLPEPKDWCEVSKGKDFLTYEQTFHINWIITNFPWSGAALRPMLRKSCQLADNVIHLVRFHNILGTLARHKDFLNENHKLKEIIVVPWKDSFINKAPEGFCLVVIHSRKNWRGNCKWTYWA